jgi:hypothetical protein
MRPAKPIEYIEIIEEGSRNDDSTPHTDKMIPMVITEESAKISSVETPHETADHKPL